MIADVFPRFDTPVPQDGYRWWYVDGISDCGRFGVVVIAFVGSVFSPYYYSARQRGRGNPNNHCSINVALYGPGVNRWAMTERCGRKIALDSRTYRSNRSELRVEGSSLTIDIDERAVPIPRRLRGRISIEPRCLNDQAFPLDPHGRHQWQPIAPIATMDLNFEAPAIHWRGHAYVDSNYGERALEDDFLDWHWSRSAGNDAVEVRYETRLRDQTERRLALRFAPEVETQTIEAGSLQNLKAGLWGVPRRTVQVDRASVKQTLEDTPFYMRSILELKSDDGLQLAMHEQLSLERFRRGWVRFLLPFRMPRIPG